VRPGRKFSTALPSCCRGRSRPWRHRRRAQIPTDADLRAAWRA
jgi:hypothetical protein